ncbi:MAG TPA: hypothetical protein VJ875_17645 [Pyrinomonadaceae bacterium]|nr:hypothetical protein [Pyrinomonadaceae bacterium]
MTIGIASVLRDAAVLIADGRTNRFDLPGHPRVSDDAIKIFKVADSLLILTAGIAQVTQLALLLVESEYKPYLAAPAVVDLLNQSLEAAWKDFSEIPAGIDVNNPGLNGTLLVGGLDSSSSFIAKATRHYDGQARAGWSATIGMALVGCSEDESEPNGVDPHPLPAVQITRGKNEDVAFDFFDNQMAKECCSATSADDVGEQISAVIRSGAATVKHMESQYVGGKIQYGIVRRGFPAVGDWYGG